MTADPTPTGAAAQRERLIALIRSMPITFDSGAIEWMVDALAAAGFGNVAEIAAERDEARNMVRVLDERLLDVTKHLTAERDALAARFEEAAKIAERIAAQRDEYKREWESACERADSSEHLRKEATAERDKLAAFKVFVHARLDAGGVPLDPPGEHRDEGCRVGQRLDHLFAERDALAAKLAEAENQVRYLHGSQAQLLDDAQKAEKERDAALARAEQAESKLAAHVVACAKDAVKWANDKDRIDAALAREKALREALTEMVECKRLRDQVVKTTPRHLVAELDRRDTAAWAIVRAALASPTPDDGDGWIACADRMPDGSTDVMVCEWYPHMASVEEVATAWCHPERWIFKGYDDGFDVTHWRPLPPRPAAQPPEADRH